MNTLSKLAALAFLGAATALVSPSASQAQITRQASPMAIDPNHPAPVCCMPARRTVVTDGTWVVQPPSGPAHAAAVLSTHPYYHTTLSGSQWIGNAASDGKYPGEAGTKFTYTNHFCLCGLPPGVNDMQASLYLQVFSDNEFKAYLNSPLDTAHLIGSSAPPGSFNLPATTIPSAPANLFHPGDNTLTFVVTNQASSPTGLDVAGWISGYFQALPCPHGPPIG